MIARRNRVFLWVGLLVGLSWLSLAIIDPDQNGRVSETLGLGYFFGSLFGHATLAAAWAAFGPGRLLWRLPLSLAWVFSLGVAIGINIAINDGPSEAAFVIGACFFAQWLALQVPLWGLKLGFHSHLRHVDDPQTFNAERWQFGTRQLMIVTAIVGVAFGIGRIVVGSLLPRLNLSGGELPIFLFLVASAIVFSLPLLIAALLERWSVLGVLVILVLIGAGTVAEAPLMQQVTGGGSRPNVFDLLSINGFTAGLVLAVAIIVRLCGYSLTRRQPGLSKQ